MTTGTGDTQDKGVNPPRRYSNPKCTHQTTELQNI